MTSTIPTPVADLAALKKKQQQTWASGDYAAVAATLQLISERLIDSADLQAGWRVLDVAGGSGNASLAAARAGCEVICTDYVPSLLERARERAAAERLSLETREADAEALPFEDASFDAVVSAIGAMFAANHAAAASELLRVCRPGGTIALASWTPDGFVGAMFRTVAKHVPQPALAQPPTRWGSVERLEELLADRVDHIVHRLRTYTFRFRSPDQFVHFFRDNYGPTYKAFAALDDEGQQALHDDLVALIGSHARTSGTGSISIPATYLESVAIRTG
jgi:ubiquinone/menaquinone biosynthesis C-methylase UbiE